jgi:hypothetical protein
MAAVFVTGASVAGYAIPVGLLLWPAAVRSSRRSSLLSAPPKERSHAGYSVPSYGEVGHK